MKLYVVKYKNMSIRAENLDLVCKWNESGNGLEAEYIRAFWRKKDAVARANFSNKVHGTNLYEVVTFEAK